MKKKSSARAAFFNLRVLLGVTLSFLGLALAIFAGMDGALRSPQRHAVASDPGPARYMPVPGANTQEEASGLARLEQYWNERLTYPTGRFNPAPVACCSRRAVTSVTREARSQNRAIRGRRDYRAFGRSMNMSKKITDSCLQSSDRSLTALVFHCSSSNSYSSLMSLNVVSFV